MTKAIFRQPLLIPAIGSLILISILAAVFLRLGSSVRQQLGLSPTSVVQLITDGESMIASTNGRVNILLLGVGGGNHEGADLTDTIMLVSLHLKNRTLGLVSIPRDIWSEALQDKINSAYHYAEAKEKGSGLAFSSRAVEEITGLPVHYAMVVDFSQFESLINYIGGIDVFVPASFTDTQYPIAGKENDPCDGDPVFACRYETVTFQQGVQHMDGKRALAYVRSRHAEGNEGTDFSRGKRQQDVIVAIKTKILTLQPWYHPDMSLKLIQSFDDAVTTNLTTGQLLALGKLSSSVDPAQIRKVSMVQYLKEIPFERYERYALEPAEDQVAMKAHLLRALD